jgi:hypothetical protein
MEKATVCQVQITEKTVTTMITPRLTHFIHFIIVAGLKNDRYRINSIVQKPKCKIRFRRDAPDPIEPLAQTIKGEIPRNLNNL